MTARIGVVTFPGSLDDRDAHRAVQRAGAQPVELWHGDASLHGVDAVILPGGFSYGDYLRCGAIARFAPVMGELIPAGRPRAARARHLQWLPDPLRGPSAARCTHPQRGTALREPGHHDPDRERYVSLDRAVRGRSGGQRGPQERRGCLHGGCADAGEARGGRPGPLPVRQRQPQRVGRTTSPASSAKPGTSQA